MPEDGYDLAVVGAGIVGLAHALAAARAGKRVVVFDRDARANGASVRNFGFVTVTGQPAGETWQRARRSREVWVEVAAAAGIPVDHRGLVVVARREEAMAVLEAFRATAMGEDCALMPESEAHSRFPALATTAMTGALWSPHELRVESRVAIPRLAAWLEEAWGVTIHRGVAVRAVEPPLIDTSAGPCRAAAAVVCSNDDLRTLFADRIAACALKLCTLQMLRTRPQPRSWRLAAAVMSDLSLVRYRGYADLAAAAALRARLEREAPAALAAGVHLIVVQGGDGALVVGDSHHDDDVAEPFAAAAVEDLILAELRDTVNPPEMAVAERWTGVYPHAADRMMLVDRPAATVRIVLVTSGTGASTAFAIAEEVVGELLNVSGPVRES